MSKLEELNKMSNEDLCILYQNTDDDDVIEVLIKKNKSLIIRILKKLFKNDLSNSDKYHYLLQCANIAVWYTAKGLDVKKGKFSIYLSYVILKCTRKYMYEFSQITTPYYIMYDKERKQKLKEDGLLNISSLDEILYNNGDNDPVRYEDFIADDTDLSAVVIHKDESKRIMKILYKLKPNEQFVIISRFGLNGEGPKTLQEIGDICEVSRERIRQIKENAIKKLRKILDKSDKDEF